MTSILTICTFIILAIGCSALSQNNQQNGQDTSLEQGISGVLLERSGDFMPSPENDAPPRGNEKPAKGKIHVYEAINVSKTGPGPYFQDLGEPVSIIETDEDGHFSQQLPPGTYSLFIKTSKGLYANRFDGQGIIEPVQIAEGEVTEVKLILDNEATY